MQVKAVGAMVSAKQSPILQITKIVIQLRFFWASSVVANQNGNECFMASGHPECRDDLQGAAASVR
jgi:hypothetical protein